MYAQASHESPNKRRKNNATLPFYAERSFPVTPVTLFLMHKQPASPRLAWTELRPSLERLLDYMFRAKRSRGADSKTPGASRYG